MSIRFPKYKTPALSPIILPLWKLNKSSERVSIAYASKTGYLVPWSSRQWWKSHCFNIKVNGLAKQMKIKKIKGNLTIEGEVRTISYL